MLAFGRWSQTRTIIGGQQTLSVTNEWHCRGSIKPRDIVLASGRLVRDVADRPVRGSAFVCSNLLRVAVSARAELNSCQLNILTKSSSTLAWPEVDDGSRAQALLLEGQSKVAADHAAQRDVGRATLGFTGIPVNGRFHRLPLGAADVLAAARTDQPRVPILLVQPHRVALQASGDAIR